MLTFSAGINVTPVDQPEVSGILDQEGLAEKFFIAVARGRRVPIDMSDNWNHWAWVEQPLAQARAELNITPPAYGQRNRLVGPGRSARKGPPAGAAERHR